MSCSGCGYALCVGCTYRVGGAVTCSGCFFSPDAPTEPVSSPVLAAQASGEAVASDIPIGNGADEEKEVAGEPTPTPPPTIGRVGLVVPQQAESTPESTPLVPPPSREFRPGDVLVSEGSTEQAGYGLSQVRRTYMRTMIVTPRTP